MHSPAKSVRRLARLELRNPGVDATTDMNRVESGSLCGHQRLCRSTTRPAVENHLLVLRQLLEGLSREEFTFRDELRAIDSDDAPLDGLANIHQHKIPTAGGSLVEHRLQSLERKS